MSVVQCPSCTGQITAPKVSEAVEIQCPHCDKWFVLPVFEPERQEPKTVRVVAGHPFHWTDDIKAMIWPFLLIGTFFVIVRVVTLLRQ
jgi:hypothetical protein